MIDPTRNGDGPIPAQILLVGEYWGESERRAGAPFQGYSGVELNRMLHEAGIMRSECYCTNVVNAMPAWADPPLVPAAKKEVAAGAVPFAGAPLGVVNPPFLEAQSRLLREIEAVNPNIIVALGNAAMLALTGKWSVQRWRGSQLLSGTRKLIPTLNPAAVVREWSFRPAVINDLKRVAAERSTEGYSNVPKWNFHIRPSADGALRVLERLLAQVDSGELSWIDFDLETAYGHITCAGISWSRLDAISIPFVTSSNRLGYFTPEEEAAVVFALYRLLTHPKVKVRGQNLLYDCQYTHRHWHFVPRVAQDTMISHHTCFAGLRKSLDFQASLYCDHYVQWKPEKENWKEGG